MDATQIVQTLTGNVLALVLFYFLIQEQRAHTETRRQRDNDNREWMTKYSELAKTSAVAIEAVNDALHDIRDVLKEIRGLTRTPTP